MRHLVHSLNDALSSRNYYSALTLALTIPDICGWIDDPSQGSKARCIKWFDRFMKTAYTKPATTHVPELVFLTGTDFYALRCAYLHEGRDEISTQQARKVLERFEFVVAPDGWTVHCNQHDDTLQLQVDVFCRQIAAGAETFLSEIDGDESATRRMGQLLRIRDVNGQTL